MRELFTEKLLHSIYLNLKMDIPFNLFLLIYLLALFITFKTSAEINLDGNKTDIKILDKISSKNELIKLVNNEELFKKAGVNMVLLHPKLEADDCIALTIQNIKRVVDDYNIHIVTSDMDYLQLADENVKPINLKYKYLQDSKQSFKDNKKEEMERIPSFILFFIRRQAASQ